MQDALGNTQSNVDTWAEEMAQLVKIPAMKTWGPKYLLPRTLGRMTGAQAQT